MAEEQSSQEKSEKPSAHKLQKSKSEGQVARSKDVATMVSLLATLFLLKIFAGYFFDILSQIFALSFADFAHKDLATADLRLLIARCILLLAFFLLPLAITPIFVVLVSLIPGGWTFSSKNFAPNLGKLNPIKGIGRIFSMQNLSELLKSLLKVGVLLGVGWALIRSYLPEFISLQNTHLTNAIIASLSLAFDLMLVLMLVFVVFSLIDIPLQKFFFLKKLRMSKQELKEEHKNQEGKPEVKAKIKQLQRQLLHRQISKTLKTADVVIVNPEHYAVAVKYDNQKAQAPYVVAKGTDETALYIKQLSAKYGLDVVEVPPLARAIYFTTQVQQQIPAPLFTAVAYVLSYVMQMRSYRQGRRKKPLLPTNLPIPAHLAQRA